MSATRPKTAAPFAAQAAPRGGDWQWGAYAADPHSSHYAPLDQIDESNVGSLRPAWELETLPAGVRAIGMLESTPIVVDGVMYLSGYGLFTHAVEAATGKTIWTNKGFDEGGRRTTAAGVSRGVAYWKDGRDERIFAPVREHVFAIDATTGKLIDRFGSGGAIEVQKDFDHDLGPGESVASTTPGVIFEDLYILPTRNGEGPSKSAPGHIRAYDCRTGKRRWIFHTIPHPGEFGYETWSRDSWKTNGGANCWGGMSVDRERGLVFFGLGSPAFDFWGGDRKGQNLFGNCVVCLDARTGERRWHFQTVHHDLWDYDLPCPPNLVTVMHNGRPRDAVAQVAKTGWVYLLDRETGEPLYPIEERPVPRSTVPGEEAWPTQPFPTHPPAFSRQYFGPGDVSEVMPDSREFLMNERLKGVAFATMYTPPRLDQEVICFPGYHGGGLWGGGAWRADQGVLYLTHNEIPWSLKLVQPAEGAAFPFEHTGYLRPEDKHGYPAIQPPWGRVSAIDLNSGKILWQVAHGEYKELTARGVPRTGTYNRGGVIATRGGVLFASGTLDNAFRAYSQRDGRVLFEYDLGGGGYATPSTYQVDGRQYVVIASSPRSDATGSGPKAGFTAFALPR